MSTLTLIGLSLLGLVCLHVIVYGYGDYGQIRALLLWASIFLSCSFCVWILHIIPWEIIVLSCIFIVAVSLKATGKL